MWYNKLSPTERQKILKEYESEALQRKAFADHDKMLDEMDEENEEEKQEKEEAAKMVKGEGTLLEGTVEKPKESTTPIADGMNRSEAAKKDGSPDFISVPAFKIPYVATPKVGFEGKDGPIIIKALPLEEGANINGWRVVREQFQRVADQYKAGRQLRVNHGKNVQDVFGKSFNGVVLKGSEVETYLGKKIEGLNPDGLYVGAEFEANPQDPQLRTNILQGYVETGSIGLDAKAFCEKCDKPLYPKGDKFERTCKHYDSPIKLTDVEVKEYSYVAEPAFEHTMAFPSFSAAVSNSIQNSSLTKTADEAKPLQMTEETKVEATADAKTKKAEADADAEGEGKCAEAIAEAYIKYYKKGWADAEAAFKKKAEGEGEGEGKTRVKATVTDQVTQTVPPIASAPSEPTMNDRIFHPTKVYSENSVMKIFAKACIEHPTTPADLKAKLKGVFNA